MPLRQRLEAVPEAVQEFDLAAAQKYQEGAALIVAGYDGAGIYLLGYSAEMMLKNAYFRCMGASWADRIAPRLGLALAAGRALTPLVPHEGYHSLRFWASLLRETRRFQRRPLPPLLDAQFVSRTRRLHQNCWIGARYRRAQATGLEAATVQADAAWIQRNYSALWR